MRPIHWLILALIGSPLMGGCGTTPVNTGSGKSITQERRTPGTFLDDELIELKSQNLLGKDREIKEQTHINVTSVNGRVLLSGEAPGEALRERAARLVSGLAKVRQVQNELVLAAPSSLLTRSGDTLITAKLKARMLNREGLDPTAIKVVTENGTVFLMGVVSRWEAQQATDIARSESGVQRVVKLFEYLD